MGFSEHVWDPAVCLLWWKFILRSSAFPTSTRTPFRVHYAKSITFAFSLCVEPLNSITIACCHDNTIMHFLQRGNGMSDTERSVAGMHYAVTLMWESGDNMDYDSSFSNMPSLWKNTFYTEANTFVFQERGGGCLNLSATFSSVYPHPTHTCTEAPESRLHLLWTGSLSTVFITVSYSESAKLTKLPGMCFK